MDVNQAIRERRTIGAFTKQPVPREEVEALLEAAIWAPNHKHTEPWRFHVVAGDARGELADAIMAEAAASGIEHKKNPRGKLLRSPQFIAVTQRAVVDDPVRDREDYAAVCCAVQNLMLAAHARGLATKWSTGALAESTAAKHWFGLEPHDRIVAYVYLGYAPENVRIPAPERQPVVVEWRG